MLIQPCLQLLSIVAVSTWVFLKNFLVSEHSNLVVGSGLNYCTFITIQRKIPLSGATVPV